MILFENLFRIFRNISYFISYLGFVCPLIFAHTKDLYERRVANLHRHDLLSKKVFFMVYDESGSN